MALRIPQNQSIQSKYTAGKEYMFNTTYREYIGHYYELNNKLFAGKEFNPLSPEIILIQSDKVNKLLTNPNTFAYGKISGTRLDNSNISPFHYIPTKTYDSNSNQKDIRYFTQKVNNFLIKEINKDTFTTLQKNPLYKTISLEYYIRPYVDGVDESFFTSDDLDQAELIIPGIKSFVIG
jgi:hypothetical protein